MHIRKLVLYNFQSHQKTTIQLAPDFNCIIGSSRVGKTSIIRAISFLLFDDWSETYIRKGASSTTVSAEFDTGLQMEREKGPDVNKIIITPPDGKTQTYERFGTAMPFEVRKLLGIFPAKIDSDYNVNLNLADQDDPAFMLSVSSGLKTKIINRLTGAHIIDSSLRVLNKEKLELSEEATRLTQDIAKVTASLDQFNNLDDISRTITTLETRFSNTDKLIVEFNILTAIKQRLQDMTSRQASIKRVLDRFIKIVPKVDQYKKDTKDLEKLRNIRQQLRENIKLLEFDSIALCDVREFEKSLMTQLKECPLCGSALKPGQEVKWLK